MSIYLYSGTPGSGKSYEAVRVAMANLKRGLFVIANFALNFTKKHIQKGYDQRFFYMTNEEITVKSLVEFAIKNDMVKNKKEHQCMVIIDEAGGRFNCRNYAEEGRQGWLDFFSQHMKIGFDFILVAQHDRMLDRQIRSVIETEFKFRQVNRYGFLVFLPFKIFVKVEYWYGIRSRVGSQFILFRKKVANYYDRFKMFTGFNIDSKLLKQIENDCKNDDEKIIETFKRQGKYNDKEIEKSVDVIFDDVAG